MDLWSAFEQRRSCRDYEPQAVSGEQLEKLLTAFTWAPSPLNMQPWEFITITSAEGKALVRGVCEEAKQGILDADGPGWVAKYGFDFVEQAPLLLAVLFNPAKGGLGSFFGQPTGAISAACAGIQNLMLAATEMGLSTLWLTFFDPARMARALGVPDKLEVAAVIPVGKPKTTEKAPPRKAPKVHAEKYPTD